MQEIKFVQLLGLILSIILILNLGLSAQSDDPSLEWAEATYESMDIDEKIGQLFMIRAHSNLGRDHINYVKKQIKDYHVGGLCFFQGDPLTQAKLTNDYQKLSKIPLLVSVDAEWGLGMRFKEEAISYPRQLMLGAIQSNRLIYEMGVDIAEQLRRIGVHINFAPVVDVNNNPDNPVINDRSFGEDKYNVASKGNAYAQGMQDAGVLACAKHFPGHGDTDVDSHADLPIIGHDKNRLDSIELYPFKSLSKNGIGSIMVAHLNVPAIDDRAKVPTTLSYKTITHLLKEELEFEGLIFTDAMEMKGVTKHYETGEVEKLAFLAGNDVLLLPEKIEASIEKIKDALESDLITEQRLKNSVIRILQHKYKLGLLEESQISIDQLMEEVNDPRYLKLKGKLIEQALTLVSNKDKAVPVKKIADQKYASLAIGRTTTSVFQNRLDDFIEMDHHFLSNAISESRAKSQINKLKEYDKVFLSLHGMNKYSSKNFGLSGSVRRFIKDLDKEVELILVIFGNPYSLKYFDSVDNIVMAYEEDSMVQDLTAQALFGVFPFKGRLPITASEKFHFNLGESTAGLMRLGYAIPEMVDIDSKKLEEIETLTKKLIKYKAAPGCQVLIAKNGKIIYDECFGYHTYHKKRKVEHNDLYDIASVTKLAGSTISIMKLQEEQKIGMTDAISSYIQELDTTNKGGLWLRDIMSHQAGLVSWLPFYKSTMSKSKKYPKPLKEFYQSSSSDSFGIKVTKDLYLRNNYIDSIYNKIYQSSLRQPGRYKYSDIGFYLIPRMIENVSNQTIDEYVNQTFYEKLGLKQTVFNPTQHFDLTDIIPTEHDRYFRRSTVHGYVHDMGAAMLGGVSGHAGLFSNTNDLAVLMQMLLNNGYYAGERFLEAPTIRYFTKRVENSTRRGLGFDMYQLNKNNKNYMSDDASHNTYGHTGFTGTCVWNDPDEDLIYIFLSNRTYPNMNNYKLVKDEYREKIHSVIYDAML